jgi:NO-binding membrane sensor protein with MHYT domain/two-component sensor histidine kinase
MVGSYNNALVVLSIVVAIVSSYVTFDLASRLTASHGRKQLLWLAGGALSMGSGIWSMHFIGMLAFTHPQEMAYDLWITLVSLLLPMAVSGFALFAVSRGTVSTLHLMRGAAVMGMGIVSMHYVGMAAMRMDPPMRYRAPLVALSILIAVIASFGGLWSALRLRMETILTAFWKKAGSAVVMGFGIAGMHYTGMAATLFAPGSVSRVPDRGIDSVWLAGAVGVVSLGLLAATLLISAFDAYVAEHSTRHAESLKRLNDELEQSHLHLEERVAERAKELARMHQRLVDTEEAERRRLSRELHDRVGQNLTALGINLDIMKTQLADGDRAWLQARLDDSMALVNSTTDVIEDVMSELRPSMLDDFGLLPALQWYAQEFAQRTGIKVTVSGVEPERRLPPETEIALFRIAQEALNNAAKHARAAHIELELEQLNDDYVVAITDDGVGFDPEVASAGTARQGYGLGLMKERAQTIAARFELSAAPGAGTRITIRVPN